MKYVIKGEPSWYFRSRELEVKDWDNLKQNRVVKTIEIESQHDERPMFSGPTHLAIDFYFKVTPKKKALDSHFIYPPMNDLLNYFEEIATGILFEKRHVIVSISCRKLYDNIPRTEFTLVRIKE